MNGALCTVFLRGGPLSPTLICHRSLSVHGRQCVIVSAKSPSFRPDQNNAFLPNSDPGFSFSYTHKGILSYCPCLRRGLSQLPTSNSLSVECVCGLSAVRILIENKGNEGTFTKIIKENSK